MLLSCPHALSMWACPLPSGLARDPTGRGSTWSPGQADMHACFLNFFFLFWRCAKGLDTLRLQRRSPQKQRFGQTARKPQEAQSRLGIDTHRHWELVPQGKPTMMKTATWFPGDHVTYRQTFEAGKKTSIDDDPLFIPLMSQSQRSNAPQWPGSAAASKTKQTGMCKYFIHRLEAFLRLKTKPTHARMRANDRRGVALNIFLSRTTALPDFFVLLQRGYALR